jgi:hypothetical protein
MQEFIAKHKEEIAGVLSGFDRLVFRGTLRSISYAEGMMGYLWAKQVRLTEFGKHVLRVSERLKQAGKAKAEALGRPVKYLVSAGESKEEVARGIAARDKIEEGLVCVLSCVETCRTFDVYRNREKRIAHPEVPILVSVLDASGVWIFKSADANVVSVFGAGVRERAGVAGAADGWSGDELHAAG